VLNTQKILFVYIFFRQGKLQNNSRNKEQHFLRILFAFFKISLFLGNDLGMFSFYKCQCTLQSHSILCDVAVIWLFNFRSSEILSSGDTDFVFIFLMKRKITFSKFSELSPLLLAYLCNAQGKSRMCLEFARRRNIC
jgi:hypothetical protein